MMRRHVTINLVAVLAGLVVVVPFGYGVSLMTVEFPTKLLLGALLGVWVGWSLNVSKHPVLEFCNGRKH